MTDDFQTHSLRRLIDIGLALSADHNPSSLMERILLEAKEFANADGGTLYLKEGEQLLFEIIKSDSLNISQGGTTGVEINLPPVELYLDGEPNHKQVASYAALSGKTVNIKDAYEVEDFDFSGTKAFDKSTGYRSKSFLTVPLKNHQDECIGVLQLLNALDADGEVVSFSETIQPMIEALASLAAVALENTQLIEGQKVLFESFIELIATAVDAKSPYTGGHCQRVPELTKMLVGKVCEQTDGPFADFDLNEDEWFELHVAGWLHDCGKVTTPEYVVDKATKLETIYDRIHEVRMRFEVLKRDAEIRYLKGALESPDNAEALKADYEAQVAQLDEEFTFIANANVGGEFMKDEDIERIQQIGDRTWVQTLDDRIGISYDEAKRKAREPAQELPRVAKLLDDRYDHIVEWDVTPQAADPENKYGFKIQVPENKYNLGERYNLSVRRGTLTNEERYKINDHIVQTIVMLEQLPFPKGLKQVPEYAGGHHETMIGTGYPKKLTADDMSIPAKVMAIADIFEALTAADRPYKAPKTLSQSLKIMSFMRNDQHIDAELFKLFLTSGAYMEYAEKFLEKEQVDDVDINQYL